LQTIHDNRALETTQMAYNWWLDHKTVVPIHNGVLLRRKE
jgi:hypothetical protein